MKIATMCGFADQSHFSRLFSRVHGTSPGAWRREHRIEVAAPQSGPRGGCGWKR